MPANASGDSRQWLALVHGQAQLHPRSGRHGSLATSVARSCPHSRRAPRTGCPLPPPPWPRLPPPPPAAICSRPRSLGRCSCCLCGAATAGRGSGSARRPLQARVPARGAALQSRGIAADAWAVLQACELLATRCCRCAASSRELWPSRAAIAAGVAAHGAARWCSVRCRCAIGQSPLRVAHAGTGWQPVPKTACNHAPAYATLAGSANCAYTGHATCPGRPRLSKQSCSSQERPWPRARSPSASVAGRQRLNRAPPLLTAAAAAAARWCLRRRPAPPSCGAWWASRCDPFLQQRPTCRRWCRQAAGDEHGCDGQPKHQLRLPASLPQVPPEILNDAALNAAIAILPANYNFEIHKTVSADVAAEGCLAGWHVPRPRSASAGMWCGSHAAPEGGAAPTSCQHERTTRRRQGAAGLQAQSGCHPLAHAATPLCCAGVAAAPGARQARRAAVPGGPAALCVCDSRHPRRVGHTMNT